VKSLPSIPHPPFHEIGRTTYGPPGQIGLKRPDQVPSASSPRESAESILKKNPLANPIFGIHQDFVVLLVDECDDLQRRYGPTHYEPLSLRIDAPKELRSLFDAIAVVISYKDGLRWLQSLEDKISIESSVELLD